MSFLRLQISEDWTVVVLGLAIIFLALLGIVIPSPIFNWTNAGDLTNVVFSGKNLLAILAQFVLIYGVAILAASMLRQNLRAILFMLPAVYLLTLVALILAGNAFFKEYNGKGYANEAGKAAIQFWREEVGLDVCIITFDNNFRSQKCARNLGLVEGGFLTIEFRNGKQVKGRVFVMNDMSWPQDSVMHVDYDFP